MKEPDPLGDFKKLFLRKKLEEIVVIPATLYFPSAIVAQLNEICDQSGYTPGQLVVRALKSQIYHWERFYLYDGNGFAPRPKDGGEAGSVPGCGFIAIFYHIKVPFYEIFCDTV